MSIDPIDDCTFWYSQQYYNKKNGTDNNDWATRIIAFKFRPRQPVLGEISPAEPCDQK